MPNHKMAKVRTKSATSRDRSETRVYVVYVPRTGTAPRCRRPSPRRLVQACATLLSLDPHYGASKLAALLCWPRLGNFGIPATSVGREPFQIAVAARWAPPKTYGIVTSETATPAEDCAARQRIWQVQIAPIAAASANFARRQRTQLQPQHSRRRHRLLGWQTTQSKR